jgi:hypothetical protein
MVDKLFDRTEHSSYFSKLNFGSKERFKTLNNSSLYLLILMWLRQLEEYYFSFEDNGDFRSDWNKYGNYFDTPFMLKAAPLASIHMAQASEHLIPVTHVKYFAPDNRKGVCVPLEEWGANILNQTFHRYYMMLKRPTNKLKYGTHVLRNYKGVFLSQGKTSPRV